MNLCLYKPCYLGPRHSKKLGVRKGTWAKGTLFSRASNILAWTAYEHRTWDTRHFITGFVSKVSEDSRMIRICCSRFYPLNHHLGGFPQRIECLVIPGHSRMSARASPSPAWHWGLCSFWNVPKGQTSGWTHGCLLSVSRREKERNQAGLGA